MNNALVNVFNFEGAPVRTAIEKGDPWFCAKDVCDALEIGNTTMVVSKLDPDEVTLSLIEGSHRPTNMINESGLYSLILTSRKPEAKRFKKWVTGEVLPSIRKTGSYVPAELTEIEVAKRYLLEPQPPPPNPRSESGSSK